MKNILYLLLITFSISANAQEINYYNKSWAEIKAKAKAENKFIMVDAYTDWCGWCKVMDKETMKDPKVAELLNTNFVPVKMEMEHGEGILMSMKYHVSGFPTFMIFNPAGEYVYTVVGYTKTEAFLAELNNSTNKNKQFSAPGFSEKLELDFPQFYKKAYAGNNKRTFPTPDEVTAYLDNQKDLFSEVNWGVMSRFDGGEKYNKFFLDNISRFVKMYGQGSVSNKVDMILYKALQEANNNKDAAKLNGVLAMIDKYVPEKERVEQKENFKISFYTQTNDWLKLTKVVDERIANDGYKSSQFINSVSWSLYENCDDRAALKKAIDWMAKVVELEAEKYAFMDTYASLLYKTNQLREAEVWAIKAIAAGEKSGDKTDETKQLLDKIKKAR